MPRHDSRRGRNFGWGKPMAYAGKNALRTHYKGRYATVAAHTDRWRRFTVWCREQAGVKDARDVTKALVEAYGHYLAEKVRERER